MVSGSRGWTDRHAIFDVFMDIEGAAWAMSDEPIYLMHGCARGADQLAASVARELGWIERPFPAHWDEYGKRAGMIRNIAMLNGGPDEVHIFWDGESRGTKHVIEECRKRGLNHTIHREAS